MYCNRIKISSISSKSTSMKSLQPLLTLILPVSIAVLSSCSAQTTSPSCDVCGTYFIDAPDDDECITINDDGTWGHQWSCNPNKGFSNHGKWERMDGTDFGDILALYMQNNDGEYYTLWETHEDSRMPYGTKDDHKYVIFGGSKTFIMNEE